MTVTVLGSLSVGAVIPIAPLSLAQLAALQPPLSAQQAQLATTAAIMPTLPDPAALAPVLTSLGGNLPALAQSVAALPGNLAGVQSGLGAQIATLASLLAAASALASTISSAVAEVGVAAYAYEGPAGSLGDSLQEALGGGIAGGNGSAATVHALILATESSATWAALAALLKTTP